LILVKARELFSRIEAAEEELFIANRRLIVSCVKPFTGSARSGCPTSFRRAPRPWPMPVRKFDFVRGTPFYSYSQTAIQNRLRNFFRDHVRAGSFGIRPNREMQLVKGMLDTWRRDYGEEPTDEAVAKIADLPLERIGQTAPVRGCSGSACPRRPSRWMPPSMRMAATCTS
jgi:hypothetical protein